MNENTEVEYFAKRLMVGSCLLTLQQLDDESIDSIVTDPPYELGFMGKKWDASGIAYSVALWTECLRVLKPGGHLLAFGGTRTSHRMVCAIEDAGFEVRDSIHWTYGSGFPKSLNVSKAIDKAAGAEREVVGTRQQAGAKFKETQRQIDNGGFNDPNRTSFDVTAPATPAAGKWEGWGTALKPSHEPIVVARKPLTGTVAGNVLAHGTGALNIDACRVGDDGARNNGRKASSEYDAMQQKYGDYGAQERVNYGTGRWPANTVLTHAADCQAGGHATDKVGVAAGFRDYDNTSDIYGTYKQTKQETVETTVTRYACVPGCPVAEMDRQSGPAGAAAPASGPTYSGPSKSGSMAGAFNGNGDTPPAFHADKGGASRFFTQANWDETWDSPHILYVAKPSKRERNAGLDGLPVKGKVFNGASSTAAGQATGSVEDKFSTTPTANSHPTVKPVALMRHLVRLVTPPGGTVLDPFLGSGTTAVAAVLEGMEWRGCEMTEDYLPIIKGRVAHAQQEMAKVKQQSLPGVL